MDTNSVLDSCLLALIRGRRVGASVAIINVDIDRFQLITQRYANLRIAIVGDFCLDRYLEIDPEKQEMSIETGLAVHNVVNVRSQPGGAGTILNNLAALGIGRIFPIGFAGDDGDGFELQRALASKPNVRLEHFSETHLRRTFTYAKPLITEPGKPPVELNRLDFKNWTPTPALVQGRILNSIAALTAQDLDAMILLDQAEVPETGVITSKVLAAVEQVSMSRPDLLILADSRRGLRNFPPVTLKMNRSELSALTGAAPTLALDDLKQTAAALSKTKGKSVFVTLSEQGIIGASPDGEVAHVPALPVRGALDIVGAGDAVTANLTCALAAGASIREALELGNAAASIVIHQLGTTGTATVAEIQNLVAVPPK